MMGVRKVIIVKFRPGSFCIIGKILIPIQPQVDPGVIGALKALGEGPMPGAPEDPH